MTDWQPIETAPRDGRSVVVWMGRVEKEPFYYLSHRGFVAFYLGKTEPSGFDLGWAIFPGMAIGEEWITHWMPLPPPPAAEEGEG